MWPKAEWQLSEWATPSAAVCSARADCARPAVFLPAMCAGGVGGLGTAVAMGLGVSSRVAFVVEADVLPSRIENLVDEREDPLDKCL